MTNSNRKINRLAIHFLLLSILISYNNCTGYKAIDSTDSLSSSGIVLVTGNDYLKVGAYDSFVGPVFDYSSLIPEGQGIPENYGPEEGAFRFGCYASHEAYDDPIVYPGQPGRSHLHTFFGNTLADGNSTYESLRRSGNSSCGNELNRSAYWMPALLTPDAKQVIRPDIIIVYYKRSIDGAKACTTSGIDCKALPRGLRYIYGYDFKTGDPGVARWKCVRKDNTSFESKSNIVDAAKDCNVGDTLLATLDSAPNCWDGVNLDTPDHRSHLSYGSYGSWGYYKCPNTHPYIIPGYTIKAFYTIDETLDRSGTYTPGVTKTWHLSSDYMGRTKMPGETLHADWFGAWDDHTMDRWMKGCINKALSGNNGDLCDGGRSGDAGYNRLTPPPRLAPVPPMPAAMHMKMGH